MVGATEVRNILHAEVLCHIWMQIKNLEDRDEKYMTSIKILANGNLG
jgi:hypothetical protein